MNRRALAALVATVLAGAPAWAQPTDRGARVVQIAADAVYVDRGERDGLRKGDELAITLADGRSTRATVAELGPHSARAALVPDAPLPAVGARVALPSSAGTPPATDRPASDAAPEARAPRRLAAPRSAEQLAAQWLGVETGRPARVPYREHNRALPRPAASPHDVGASRGRLALSYAGHYELAGGREPYHRVDLRSDLQVPAVFSDAVDYAHAARLRLDIAPGASLRFDDSRSSLYLYRLRIGAALPRLGARLRVGRIAAAPVPEAGLVDGASARAELAPGLHVGAFGGLSPAIDDLGPRVDGTRFGVYTGYRAAYPRAAASPARSLMVAADLGVIGTTYDGALDRRALAMRTHVSSSRAWGHAELVLDSFGADHPARDAGAGAIDLSRASLDVGARPWRWLRASVRVDRFRALRTREVAARLPVGYSSGTVYTGVSGHADLGLPAGVGVHLRGGYRAEAADAAAVWAGAGATLSGLGLAGDRASVSATASAGRFIDQAALRANYRLPLARGVELEPGYRLSVYRYDDENRRLWSHAPSLEIDGNLRLAGWRGTASLRGEAELGPEVKAAFALASLALRW